MRTAVPGVAVAAIGSMMYACDGRMKNSRSPEAGDRVVQQRDRTRWGEPPQMLIAKH